MLKSSLNIRLFNGAILAAMVVGAVSSTAMAGLFDDEEARRDIAKLKVATEQQSRDLDAKLIKLDEAIKSLGIVQIINQLDQVNAELAKLRGQNEVMVNQFEQMQKRQKDFYFDLDARIRKLEGATPDAPAGAAPVAPATGMTLVTPPAVLPAAGMSPERPMADIQRGWRPCHSIHKPSTMVARWTAAHSGRKAGLHCDHPANAPTLPAATAPAAA